MISIQAYRAVIGLFYLKARHITQQHSAAVIPQPQQHQHQNSYHVNNYLSDTYFLTTFIVVLVGIFIYCNVNLASLKLLLLCAGDIETNPGPTYTILKLVKASYHQGNTRFGSKAGTQCACNSLFALVWSIIRKVSLWNTNDLNYILDMGNSLYSKLNLDRPLSINDLPSSVNTGMCDIYVEMLENETGCLSIHNQSNFLQDMRKKCVSGDGLLFIIHGYTFSVLWNKRNYFLFDPHSRDEEGAIVPNGTCVLLKFSSLSQLQKYIFEIYFPLNTQPSEVLLFEAQFVSLHKNDSVIVDNVSPIAKEERKAANRIRKAAHFEEIKGTDAHEQLKASKRIWKSVHFEKIKGTDGHEVLKQCDRIRKTDHLATIKSTHAHEQLKAMDRTRKNIETIKDTDIHTRTKEIDRKRKLENFNRFKGTPQHEDIKKAKRIRQ